MLAGIIGLAAFIVVLAVWIYSLVNWDGKKHCKPEDCDSCPFPPCTDEEKQEIFNQKE